VRPEVPGGARHPACSSVPNGLTRGQKHLEQVQRGGGETAAHLGGAGLRLCIRDHFKLRQCTSQTWATLLREAT